MRKKKQRLPSQEDPFVHHRVCANMALVFKAVDQLQGKNESRDLWASQPHPTFRQGCRTKFGRKGKLKVQVKTNGIKFNVSLYKVAVPTNLIIFI